jgi:hypothetical protein
MPKIALLPIVAARAPSDDTMSEFATDDIEVPSIDIADKI